VECLPAGSSAQTGPAGRLGFGAMTDANQYSPVPHGMRLSLRVTLVLACVYALLAVSAEVGRQVWLTQDLHIARLPIFRMGWIALPLVFFLWGTSFALVIGALTGGLIGELWLRIGRRVGGRAFSLLALVLCAAIVVGLHVIFQVRLDFAVSQLDTVHSEWPADSLGLLVSYPLLVGVPSLVYIVAGACFSYFFWHARQPHAS